MNKFARFAPRALVAGGSVAAVGSAMADTAADAVTALTSLTTSQAGFAVPLFALAIATVGIMIGIKWIKRGKNAA